MDYADDNCLLSYNLNNMYYKLTYNVGLEINFEKTKEMRIMNTNESLNLGDLVVERVCLSGENDRRQ